MKILKPYLALMFMLIAVSYSVDLHALSHTFENEHSDDKQQCELCIINHQKDQSDFAIQPNFEDFNFVPLLIENETGLQILSSQPSISSIYFRGQFFNRPPPFTV